MMDTRKIHVFPQTSLSFCWASPSQDIQLEMPYCTLIYLFFLFFCLDLVAKQIFFFSLLQHPQYSVNVSLSFFFILKFSPCSQTAECQHVLFFSYFLESPSRTMFSHWAVPFGTVHLCAETPFFFGLLPCKARKICWILRFFVSCPWALPILQVTPGQISDIFPLSCCAFTCVRSQQHQKKGILHLLLFSLFLFFLLITFQSP